MNNIESINNSSIVLLCNTAKQSIYATLLGNILHGIYSPHTPVHTLTEVKRNMQFTQADSPLIVLHTVESDLAELNVPVSNIINITSSDNPQYIVGAMTSVVVDVDILTIKTFHLVRQFILNAISAILPKGCMAHRPIALRGRISAMRECIRHMDELPTSRFDKYYNVHGRHSYRNSNEVLHTIGMFCDEYDLRYNDDLKDVHILNIDNGYRLGDIIKLRAGAIAELGKYSEHTPNCIGNRYIRWLVDNDRLVDYVYLHNLTKEYVSSDTIGSTNILHFRLSDLPPYKKAAIALNLNKTIDNLKAADIKDVVIYTAMHVPSNQQYFRPLVNIVETNLIYEQLIKLLDKNKISHSIHCGDIDSDFADMIHCNKVVSTFGGFGKFATRLHTLTDDDYSPPKLTRDITRYVVDMSTTRYCQLAELNKLMSERKLNLQMSQDVINIVDGQDYIHLVGLQSDYVDMVYDKAFTNKVFITDIDEFIAQHLKK